MNYQIIARKYRPKNFSEVIGQEKIVTILKNALKKNRIGQAYLFSGPRGVGKTTTARILVKYLNCESEGDPRPCNQCPSCNEINRGVSLDYLEIDGASNRGIDQIRALNEQLAFASPSGKYRVFVIDEVHMLTTEAFNALLKSLEEPPPKIIFVLCTTESYRIPLTIRSRCQQLFYTYVDLHLTEKHLETILKSENIPFAPHSLWELARKSEGSIRDAENLLEKVIAFNDEKEITTALVQEVLGEAPTDKKYLFLTHIHEEDMKANLELVNRLSQDGYNLNEFFYNLIEILSLLSYYKSGVKDSVALNITLEEMEQLKTCEKLFSLNEIFTLTDILFEFIHTLKNTTHQSTMVQYLLIKLHRYRTLISPGELKENILKLSRYTLPDTNLDIPESSAIQPAEELIAIQMPPKPTPPTPQSTTQTPTVDEPQNSAPLRENDKGDENKGDEKREEARDQKPLSPAPITEPKEMLQNPPSAPDVVTTPKSDLPLNAKDYQAFLQSIKEFDIDLFRLAAAFPFLKMEGKSLVLENHNDFSPERVADFKQKYQAYLRQLKTTPVSQSIHPQLIDLIDDKDFKIVIHASIVKSNLEKIKKVFPLQE